MKGTNKAMLERTLIIVSLLLTHEAIRAEPTWQEQQNLPQWAASVLGDKTFKASYALSAHLNPYYVQGDFNGDARLDLAVLIVERGTGQHGIAMLHAGATHAIIIGAGQAVGNSGKDLNWLDSWSIYSKDTPTRAAAHKPPLMKGDALFVQKLEAASGLIYWNGARYRWYQQGD